ncbi:hypothetical protein MferCBS31731_004746 [Microsporum ferrugineum]
MRSTGRGLESLVLGGGGLSLTWSYHIEFSELQTLRLQSAVIANMLQTLTRMSEGKFTSLCTLDLKTHVSYASEDINMDEATGPPHKSLGLDGAFGSSTFNVILHRHGNTLRKLRFMPDQERKEKILLSYPRMQDLQQQCQNLREVELPIPRTRGDEQEVGIYHALGRLPWLERASLLLEQCLGYSDPGDDNGQTICLDDIKTISSKDVRIAFVNIAVDSSLALSMFRAIYAKNTLIHPAKRSAFRCLNLQPKWAADFGRRLGDMDLEDII